MKKLILILSACQALLLTAQSEAVDFSGYPTQNLSGGILLNEIWANTFSSAADWNVGNFGPSELTWQIGQGLQSQGTEPISTINSFSLEDGIAMVDSDAHEGTLEIENCWIETANSIDLSSVENVHIQFQNQYLKRNQEGEYCLLEFSVDGGITWPDEETYEVSEAPSGTRFEIWPNISNLEFILNPTTVRFNISEIAAGQPEVKFRFRWVGVDGFSWFIDDVLIFEGYENDLGISGEAFAQNSAYLNYNDVHIYPILDNDELSLIEYTIYPSSQRPEISAVSSCINWGSDFSGDLVIEGIFNEEPITSSTFQLESGEFNNSQEVGGWPTNNLSSGEYDISMEVQSGFIDENPSDNMIAKSIKLDSYLMAVDNDEIRGEFPGGNFQGDSFSAGVIFEIFNSADLYSLNVAFTSGSIPEEEVKVQLWTFSLFGDFELLTESQPVQLELSDLNDIGTDEVVWKTIPFDEPVTLEAGVDIIAMVAYEGGSGVQIGEAQSEDDNIGLTSYLYFDIGSGFNWFVSRDILKVRLNFNPNGNCEEGLVLGCDDISACNYNPNAQCDDGSCVYSEDLCEVCGCTDDTACNYNEMACFDNASCCFGTCGCADENAQNYLEVFDCEIECEFHFSGTVFHDQNENGIQDDGETGIPNQEISIQPLGLTLYTNDEGGYSFISGEDNFSIQVNFLSAFPFPTSDNPISINPSDSESFENNFGFSNDVPIYDLNVYSYSFGNTFLCNDTHEYNLVFTNQGNATISGIVEFVHDSLFQGFNPITPIDSSMMDTVYMSFEELLPGQTEIFNIDLITPTVEYIGEETTNHVSVTGFFNEEQVSFGQDSISMEIACAFDPNDKQAFPLGYTDEHWLLNGTEQEFLVRFQNTGNAPAQNIRIQDTIDVNYDLSTFELRANSHSVMTTINEQTRVVDFFFEDIQLPDSVNNEPESHGLVAYSISPIENLAIGTELENTAYIYFDNNEAIITNTTWNTIHECGGEADFEVSYPGFCIGEEVTVSSIYSQLESYTWTLDGEVISSDSEIDLIIEDSEAHSLELQASNPLCSASSEFVFFISEPPTAEITENGAILTATESESYQWLLDGEELEGAIEQTYLPTEDGTYSVVVNNEGGCSSTSAEIMIVNIQEIEAKTILIYPNPMTDVAYLEFEDSQTRTIKLLDAQGKEVRVWENIATQKLEIQKGDLPAGNYLVTVLEGRKQFSVKLLIE